MKDQYGRSIEYQLHKLQVGGLTALSQVGG